MIGGRADAAVVGDWTSLAPFAAVHAPRTRRVDRAEGLGRRATPESPTVRQVVGELALGPQRSWQLSAGIEQAFGDALSVELVAYDNHLVDLVSGREDAFRFFSGPPPVGPLDTGAYENDGTGMVDGSKP